MGATYTVKPKMLMQVELTSNKSCMLDDRSLFIDFGKAAFGTLLVSIPENWGRNSIVVHLGEKLTGDSRIDRTPSGTVRYCRIEQKLDRCENPCRIVIPRHKRNTGPAAIMMPSYIGEVYPFRYVEVEDAADRAEIGEKMKRRPIRLSFTLPVNLSSLLMLIPAGLSTGSV